ncbi:universal stress protein [Actinomadura darangshiensis]|uniref:Universal stress protein n=1 Tax=Actinomadura darangshiensis TaxID=705336 RepID=A0A4R5AMV5_9ACTN|nr:universal stress protein [Actinomadura darangshiensis]TDD73335.1 universal stress protein [Actinomadura darangshiensis]
MDGVERNRGEHVLFGYDGTAANDTALRWAVEEARLRGLELVVCHSWHWPYPPGHEDPHGEAVMKRVGENLLEHGALRAAELGAPGTVRTRLMRGPVPEALLKASGRAEMVVIGSHGRVDAGGTAMEVPARARLPVIVVRDGKGRDRVVAGADGTEWCDAALGFAASEAALRHWDLHVVYGCWEPAAVAECELALFNDPDLLEKTRAAELEDRVGPWRDRYPKVDIRVSLLLERPWEALSNAAEDAGLVVLGDRGTGTGPLGSTAAAMLRGTRGTVAIVPAEPA